MKKCKLLLIGFVTVCILAGLFSASQAASKGSAVKKKIVRSVKVVSPNGGEHFPEACTPVSVCWQYHGRPESMPGEWKIEFLRNDELEFQMTSRCGVGTHLPGQPVHPICRARTPGQCFPAGEYKVRVSGGGLVDESDRSFFIGVSTTTSALFVSQPQGGAMYEKGSDMRVVWGASPRVDVEITLRKGGVTVLTESPRSSDGRETIYIPTTTAVGDDYKVRVANRDNPENWAESRPFSIVDCVPDFSFHVRLRKDSRDHIIAAVSARCRHEGRTFSGPVKFRVEKGDCVLTGTGRRWHRLFDSWEVVKTVNGPTDEVDLGAIRFSPGDPCYCYRVFADSDNKYNGESSEINNTSPVDFLCPEP